MKLHGNARTCPNSRRLLIERVIEEGWSVSGAAAAAGVSERTVYRWLGRWRQDGAEGQRDRSRGRCARRGSYRLRESRRFARCAD
jgi:transposase